MSPGLGMAGREELAILTYESQACLVEGLAASEESYAEQDLNAAEKHLSGMREHRRRADILRKYAARCREIAQDLRDRAIREGK